MTRNKKMMFASIFSSKLNSNDQLKPCSTIVTLKITFDGKFNSFFPYLDKIKDHLSMTGVA